ncbi:MAG TPA: hypothetical protein VKT30_09640 [Caulobacteraceae bacterium]|nr:hypothetical protein [Caulobacteraceae bacterium]
MSAVRYPVAATADAALSAPLGRAARESEAAALAGAAVEFASETAGPAFPTREAALDAYGGRLDDERPGRSVAVAAEDRYLTLTELAAQRRAPAAMRPAFRAGRRWPKPHEAPATVWRLVVRYWRVKAAQPLFQLEEPAARPPRRLQEMDAKALRERLAEPLRPVKAQQPLDIGLFEVRPPEAPHIVMPDE